MMVVGGGGIIKKDSSHSHGKVGSTAWVIT